MQKDFTYPSKDGITKIHAVRWIPEGKPKAVLQIVHGMVEFIGRYDRFGELLAENGFLVTGNDHLGHGASVISSDDHGYFASKNGNLCVLGDIHTLRRITREEYPDVPYFMLGHSMGSFLTRQYIEIEAEGLAGAVIMGTGVLPDGVLRAAMVIAKAEGKVFGPWHRSTLLTRMSFGSYNKRIKPARTPVDWLSKDEEIVDAYMRNPWNNFLFTSNAYYNMFKGIRYAQDPVNLEKIPKDLPILIVSGAKDPVGDYGKGPQMLYDTYRELGIKDLEIKLYPGDRHEILNETDHEIADADIMAWLTKHI